MLSILVCHSYFLRLDQKQLLRAKPYPPLATLQAVGLLRDAGYRVSFFDAMLADEVGDFDALLAAQRPQLCVFYEDNFNFLSKMCLATMRKAACEMIGAARRHGARVIASGPDVSDAPEPYLRAGADLTLAGEGLTALLELAARLDRELHVNTEEWSRNQGGVCRLDGGKLLRTAAARTPTLAKDPGLAAWDLVDMPRYRDVWRKAHGYFSLNMAASRGCPFRCTWCAKPIWGNQYVQRAPHEVAAEMGWLKRSFGPDHVWFADDIFGFRVDWVQEFAAATLGDDARIPFTIQTRADLISEQMAEALRESGCVEAWIGAESGSQQVLSAMNKGTSVAEILLARSRLKAVGIRVGFFIQLGYMGEELEDILATRELLTKARPDDIGVSVSYPLPGTKFHDAVRAQLRGKTHWHESSDLDMMFKGTYTSDFYRRVRDLLHEQVRRQGTAAETDARLNERWSGLLECEALYRSTSQRLSLIGALAT